MTRTKVLFGVLGLLAAWTLGGWIFSNWGTITLNVKEVPLSKVIRSFERQGHITLLTNLDPSSPVTLQLKKASVPEALERLAAVTSAQWSWVGALAPDKAALGQLMSDAQLTEPPQTLRWIRQPLPGMLGMGVDAPPSDPRTQVWTSQFQQAPQDGQPPSPTGLQGVLRAASQTTDATFLLPSDWNPEPSATPADGRVGELPAAAARTVSGVAADFYYLRASRWGEFAGGRPPGENPPRGGQGRGGMMGGAPGPWMDHRIEQRIAGLSPQDKIDARENWNQQKGFLASVASLPPEQRRAKFEEMMQDPVVQAKIEETQAKRDEQQTPEQRRGRYSNYLARKNQAKGGS
jgi:hypothetical protein